MITTLSATGPGRVSVPAAVVTATAQALARVNGIDEGTGREMARRVGSPEFRRWQARVRGAGFCVRPVRVAGRRLTQDSAGRREVSYSTAAEPDRVLLIRCGNRRASVCPPCSREYKGDVWQLLRAGTAGGSKGVPASVGSHPMWFLTLTGPSFGPVHGTGCGRGRGGRSASEGRSGRAGDPTCGHGRGRACPVVHAVNDPLLGEPICSDCYDYPAAVAFNWVAPELWRRFTIALKRHLAGRLGITDTALGKRLRVSYAKVAEFQRRGVVHFHAIIRIDGHGDEYPAAHLGGLDPDSIPAIIRSAAGDVQVTTRTGDTTTAVLGFGEQLDIRPIRRALPGPVVNDDGQRDSEDGGPDLADGGVPAGPVTSGMVAAYIAKYATKAAEDFGLDNRIRSAAAADAAGLRPHIARMILTAEHLTGFEEYLRLGKWLHMLGFRGHFTTKSRRFSVTLGLLRQARRDHQAGQRTTDHTSPDTGGSLSGRRLTGNDTDTDTDTTMRRLALNTRGAGGSSVTETTSAGQGDHEPVLVIGQWRFLGLGYTTPGDALLAAYAHTDHEHARKLAREQQRTENRHDHLRAA